MSDHDARIAAVLDQLNPPIQGLRYEWARVITDARFADGDAARHLGRRLWSRRRVALIAAIVAVGLAIPVITVGASKGWWFQSKHTQRWWTVWPTPVSGVPAIIATGHSHGSPWTGVAFISKLRLPKTVSHDSICFTMIVGSRSNRPQSAGCGVLRGMDGARHGHTGAWTTFSNWSFPQPPMIAGAVAKGVARVEVVLNPYPYPTGRVRTLTPPLKSSPLVGGGIRLFVVSYPVNVGVNYIVLFNNNGKIIERHRWG